MADTNKKGKSDTSNNAPDPATHIVLNGQQLDLDRHETDFTVLARPSDISDDVRAHHPLTASEVAPRLTRVACDSSTDRDGSMDEVREKNLVAHHVYSVRGTGEEIVIDDRLFLQLRHADPADLQAIKDEFHLVEEDTMGETVVLRVTSATGANPVKTANAIAQRPEVVSCSPQVRVPLQPHQLALADQLALFREQWYLTADLINHNEVDPRADIQAPEAWQVTTGNSDVVIAVMDDGFDLGHPAFRNKTIHPEAIDFAASPDDRDPSPGAQDFHGTPVASIAAGSSTGGAMSGVAPGCTVLPIRIGFGPLDQIQTLREFRHASQHADIVNCSFGFPPLSFDIFDSGFRQEMTQLTRTGGRRGRGLVIVFSAGNDDAPTRLRAADNVNGVRFLGRDAQGNLIVRSIPAGRDVVSAYPSIPGIIVVAAMSSMRRKSGYSNWGEHITVTAPSSNGHELGSLNAFRANYRGLGQIAAVNRPNHGQRSRPLRDDPSTPDLREDFYTGDFGGTSGAAPVVSGVVGLMLSVNPDLSADDVRQILTATADTDLDVNPDLANDPNLQGMTGQFVNGHSLFFGAGKVNALAAASRAQALGGPGGGTQGARSGSASPRIAISDADPQGVVSNIQIDGAGPVDTISVTVDIDHTYRGDLVVNLISPNRFVAELHRVFQGGSADDLKRTYTAADTPSLQRLVDAAVEGGGQWSLFVADLLRRDTGILNGWSLDLRRPN